MRTRLSQLTQEEGDSSDIEGSSEEEEEEEREVEAISSGLDEVFELYD